MLQIIFLSSAHTFSSLKYLHVFTAGFFNSAYHFVSVRVDACACLRPLVLPKHSREKLFAQPDIQNKPLPQPLSVSVDKRDKFKRHFYRTSQTECLAHLMIPSVHAHTHIHTCTVVHPHPSTPAGRSEKGGGWWATCHGISALLPWMKNGHKR